MKHVLFLACILISTSFFGQNELTHEKKETKESQTKGAGLNIKLSPSQIFGCRFPLIIEKEFGSSISLSFGAGPTYGRQSFHLNFGHDCGYEKKKADVKKAGVHLQATADFYLSPETFKGPKVGFFYRYGDFQTVTNGEDTYYKKHHAYLTCGSKFLIDKTSFVEIFLGAGYKFTKERFYEISTCSTPNGPETITEGFTTESKNGLSAVIVVNFGFNL